MDVQKWIDAGCDYATGLEHYKTLPGAKPALIKSLSKGPSLLNKEKLKHELKQLAGSSMQVAVQNVPAQTAGVTEADKKQALMFHQLPAELRPVYKEAMDLFRENCMLKVQLNELPADKVAEALAIQLQIHDNFTRNGKCWQKIDYWQEHRALPPQSLKGKFDTLTGGAMAKRQAHLFSSRSKLAKRVEQTRAELEATANPQDQKRLEKKLAKQEGNLINQEAQLEEITNLINGKNEPG